MNTTQIARTIQNQIGSRAFMMLGARDFVALSEGGLQFRIGGSRRVNRILVKLDRASDTYTVEAWKIGKQCKKVAECDGVYSDSINRVIESQTGLYTSL